MVIEVDGKFYLVVEHAEENMLIRSITEHTVAETIRNPDQIELNQRGREEYTKDNITVILDDDDYEQYDGIIVTVID